MYQVAICDDEPLFAQDLFVETEKILQAEGLSFAVDVYRSCDELYRAIWDEQKCYHLLLLDILMDGMDGMDFSSRLREAGGEATIVFVTATDQYWKKGYEVGAARYLEKPVDLNELRAVLLKDYHNKFCKKYILLRQGLHMRSIPIDELCCLEASGRKLLYHLQEETLEVYAPSQLTVVGEQLAEKFVQCHRSYFINVERIQEITRTEAVLQNGMYIPISRGKYREVQSKLFECLHRHCVVT